MISVKASLSAIEVSVSLLAAALTIAASAMACRAVCCRKAKPAGLPVVYNAGGLLGQQPIQLDGLPGGFTLESLLASGAQPSISGVFLNLSQ